MPSFLLLLPTPHRYLGYITCHRAGQGFGLVGLTRDGPRKYTEKEEEEEEEEDEWRDLLVSGLPIGSQAVPRSVSIGWCWFP
ncbi:hypothetical protein EYF80_016180 [Liparis tanakae]|uniref:Uncharacterized protein n=1 Tax=Liparis tanakae TaxID=230148 RepID=A0A4Z2I844_9TELE|nr:hypothetical protein EYF80_016180 [Liparis tanakae]